MMDKSQCIGNLSAWPAHFFEQDASQYLLFHFPDLGRFIPGGRDDTFVV